MDKERNVSGVLSQNINGSYEQLVREELITRETAEFIINISSCGLVPVITILGILGNILSFIVFLRQRTRDRTRVILLALAISDSCYLLMTLIRKLSCIVSMFDEIAGNNWATVMLPQGYVIGITFARITSVLTMVISIERCFAVIFPLKVRAIITRNVALKIVVVVFLVVFTLMFPLYFTTTTFWTTDKVKKTSIARVRMTDFYIRHVTELDNYIGVALATLLRIMPCVVVLLCTVSVLVALKQGQKFRKCSSSCSASGLLAEERRITVMLLAVTSLYLVCLVPGTVFTLLQRFLSGFTARGTHSRMFLLLSNVNIVLECVNSALNFVIYMKMNKRFKLTFQQIMCSSCKNTATYELQLLSNGTLSSANLG